jgi:hypothetical protein
LRRRWPRGSSRDIPICRNSRLSPIR